VPNTTYDQASRPEFRDELRPAEILVSAAEERSLIRSILTALGVPSADAQIQSMHLVEGDLRGVHSHGLQRVPVIVGRIRDDLTQPVPTVRTHWQSPSFLTVDGGRGLGPVIAYQTLETLSVRAHETGLSVGAISNSNHIGMLAPFVEHIASRGQICLAMTTSEALVHPFGGSQALLGTNPIAIGIPTASKPFVLDMASAQVSMGQILSHLQRNQPIPAGWAVDARGTPTTNPAQAAQGAISPFGGAKGYGLGLAIELLVGALTDSALGRDVHGTLDTTAVCNKGDLFLCIESSQVRSPRTLDRLASYLDQIRHSGRTRSDVFIPGDRSRALRAKRLRGGIPLPEALWRETLAIYADLGPPPC
jgi:L-2-hydroxycarboxylate dehydrogenase (NAD+)